MTEIQTAEAEVLFKCSSCDPSFVSYSSSCKCHKGMAALPDELFGETFSKLSVQSASVANARGFQIRN